MGLDVRLEILTTLYSRTKFAPHLKGVFIITLVGGLGKMERGQKSFELSEGGGTKKFSEVKEGSKKFGQIESIMKIKMHNFLLKLTIKILPQIGSKFQTFSGPFSESGIAPCT